MLATAMTAVAVRVLIPRRTSLRITTGDAASFLVSYATKKGKGGTKTSAEASATAAAAAAAAPNRTRELSRGADARDARHFSRNDEPVRQLLT